MIESTEVAVAETRHRLRTQALQFDDSCLKPVERHEDGFTYSPDQDSYPRHLTTHEFYRTFEPPISPSSSAVVVNSTPLQIWEGSVVEVDGAAQTMQITLDAKIGQIPQHTAEIDLEWVSEQDKDLVRPGAVFYLTLFKRTKRGGIENAQELRFRRRPSWSLSQLSQIESDVQMIKSKMRPLPESV